MGLPKPKQRVRLKAKPSVDSPSNFAETVQKVRPKRKVTSSEVTTIKFDENHVRWTVYLTRQNNRYLRDLLAKGEIRSRTRCANEAGEFHLKKNFGLSSEHGIND